MGAAAAGLLAPGAARAIVRPGRWAPPDPDLQAGLDALVEQHRMPGALLGVYRRGEVRTVGAGTANLNTGQPMTPETGFLTGSITKVWHATLLMTFVDEGRLALDEPVVRYLPHLRFADPEATRAVTVRQLLNHSSGVDAGDYIQDFGEGPAAHRLFVESMARLGQLHRPGAYASYNNGGWVIAGHLLEVMTGRTWHALLRDRVIRPMGLQRTFPDAEDGLLWGMAVGSVPDPARPGRHLATPKLLLPKTFAPAGATLVTTLADNLALARMHLRGGVADNGQRILSEASARAMATRTVDDPTGPASGFGLGWRHSTAGARVTLSHGGGSNGGRASLVAVPDADFAYASFVNSNVSDGFQEALEDWIAAQFLGSSGQPAARAPEGPVDRSRFLGTYRRTAVRTTIREEQGGLTLESEWIAAEAPGTEAYMSGRPTRFAMRPTSPSTLMLASAAAGSRAVWSFLEPDSSGRYALMYAGGRLSRRTGH